MDTTSTPEPRKPRVLQVIPSYTGGIKWKSFQSFTALDRSGLDAPMFGIERVIIDRARNLGAEAAMQNDCDYLLFIDDDMTFDPDALQNLLRRDKDIVAGMFFGRVEPSMHLCFDLVQTSEGPKYEKIDIDLLLDAEKKGACIPVDATGTGFTLIKVDVFRKLKELEPDTPIFATVNKGKAFMSEDVYFCQRAKEAGFQVWVDTAVKIGHIGDKIWGWDDFSKNAEGFKAQIAKQRAHDARKKAKKV